MKSRLGIDDLRKLREAGALIEVEDGGVVDVDALLDKVIRASLRYASTRMGNSCSSQFTAAFERADLIDAIKRCAEVLGRSK